MKILILCTGNSCRSQMAEGVLKSFDPKLVVFSAGTAPALGVHPNAIEVMAESGIDLSGAHPKPVSQYINESFDYVITVCDHANESCPVFLGSVQHRLHLGFEDPAAFIGNQEQTIKEFRRVRDEIKSKFYDFYRQHLQQDIFTHTE